MKRLSKYFIFILSFFSIYRITFFLIHKSTNYDLISVITSLAHGIRYDLSALSYLLFPVFLFFLFQTFPNRKSLKINNKYIKKYLIFITILIIIISIIDLGFYFEFNTRINYLAIEYLLFIGNTIMTIIKIFPYNFLFLLTVIIIVTTYKILNAKLNKIQINVFKTYNRWILSIFILFLIMAISIRGGLQKKPINWSNINTTKNRFTNILSLNPIWNLGMTMQTSFRENFSNRFNSIDINLKNSNLIARNSLQEINADFLYDDNPVLRKTNSMKPIKKHNVVIILMESFAGNYVGELGNKYNITPNFDKLTKEGVLFTKMFSSGTRTNRGLSSTLLSFPGLPRFKSILNDASVDQSFSSLANILKKRDYETYFLVGGKLDYDNRHGFFLGQGYDNFYGSNDYGDDIFKTVWGAADEHLFEKSFDILKNSNEPTFMSILTLSNHPTYEFPTPNDFIPVSSSIKHKKRFNAFKYSDWALGNFIDNCKKETFYDNTIFIILGDHGITSTKSHQNSSLDLGAYYIPCLIIAPGLNTNKNHRIASQTDIIPTILHLLGGTHIHSSWGKNLLGKKIDMDFAIIAPSGLNHIIGIIADDYYYIHNLNEQNSNELYSISNINYPQEINEISQKNIIKSKLEKKLLGVTKSAYNALISYKCGI